MFFRDGRLDSITVVPTSGPAEVAGTRVVPQYIDLGLGMTAV